MLAVRSSNDQHCTDIFFQIDQDIDQFRDISVSDLATQAFKKFDSHYHLGHYVIKDNRAYSKMIGELHRNLTGPNVVLFNGSRSLNNRRLGLF